jgi:glycosyltransferase involved in cell wall biosynthesis
VRVALLSAHFSPEVGYQEVDLARAFARMRAQVRVVTSTQPSPNARLAGAREYRSGVFECDTYETIRIPPRLALGPNVLGCKTEPLVADFRPDYAILIGPAKLFGLDVFSAATAPWRRIAVVQDNSEAGAPRPVIHRLVKRPAYRRIVRNADRIVLNVPETRGIVEEWLGPRERELLSSKGVELSLGFDPEMFFFDSVARREWRTQHRVDDEELLLVTCTRAVPGKRLEEVIDTVARLKADGLPLRYVLAGLLDDAYSETLRRHVRSQPDPSAFLLLPILRHDEIRRAFCGSDVGFWPRAAITIQQGMGTGLPVVLRRKGTVSHLLRPGENGWYIGPDEGLDQGLVAAVSEIAQLSADERVDRRERTALSNKGYLSYDFLAAEMLRAL